MKRSGSLILVLLLLAGVLLGACSAPDADDPGAVPGEQETVYIENKGSDTIVNLALAWAERYQELHSEVRISVTGGGSGTGIASLINDTVDVANASRQIKTEEIENAQENGVEPVEYVIARDAIAVIVHPDNPVDELTIAQISAIYAGLISNWSEVGGDDRPIVRLSRETNSGTHVYFLENVLRQGDSDSDVLFSTDTLLLPSSEGIIRETSQNPNCIGYDGLGYVTDEVKVIRVAAEPGEEYITPSVETVNTGQYPIARELYMYTNGVPQGELAEYMTWIFSADAQQIVAELGFVPVDNP